MNKRCHRAVPGLLSRTSQRFFEIAMSGSNLSSQAAVRHVGTSGSRQQWTKIKKFFTIPSLRPSSVEGMSPPKCRVSRLASGTFPLGRMSARFVKNPKATRDDAQNPGGTLHVLGFPIYSTHLCVIGRRCQRKLWKLAGRCRLQKKSAPGKYPNLQLDAARYHPENSNLQLGAARYAAGNSNLLYLPRYPCRQKILNPQVHFGTLWFAPGCSKVPVRRYRVCACGSYRSHTSIAASSLRTRAESVPSSRGADSTTGRTRCGGPPQASHRPAQKPLSEFCRCRSSFWAIF